MLGNCKILKYNAFYGCVVCHQHLALVATRLGPDVGDLCQMRQSGTRMNAMICIYSNGEFCLTCLIEQRDLDTFLFSCDTWCFHGIFSSMYMPREILLLFHCNHFLFFLNRCHLF